MTALHATRRPRRTSYHSFPSNLDGLLRENGIRTRSGPSLPVAGASTEQSAAAAPVVGQVQTFVDEHLAADLTVKQRVERVKRLLATTDCSLASIALDTGFYDQAHLTRTFKRLEGVTPGTYRDEADE